MLQALLTSLQPNHGLQGGSHGTGPRDDPIETSLIEALSCLQSRPNFHEIVSTTSDYHQTLAHLAIIYGYPSLLGCLVEWHIDLTIADVNGLTALHCAYMKGDPDTVRILRRGGASESATDKLGRTPSELQPEGLEGFDSDIDPGVERAAGMLTGFSSSSEASFLEFDWPCDWSLSSSGSSALNYSLNFSCSSISSASEDTSVSKAVDSLPGGSGGFGGGIMKTCTKCGTMESQLSHRMKRCTGCDEDGLYIFYCVRIFLHYSDYS